MLYKKKTLLKAGADSFNKIKSDFENQSLTNDFDELYSEIIKIPKKKQYNVNNFYKLFFFWII